MPIDRREFLRLGLFAVVFGTIDSAEEVELCTTCLAAPRISEEGVARKARAVLRREVDASQKFSEPRIRPKVVEFWVDFHKSKPSRVFLIGFL